MVYSVTDSVLIYDDSTVFFIFKIHVCPLSSDVYRDAGLARKGSSIAAVVATLNDAFTRYHSVGVFQREVKAMLF